jgi:hypothetical protein
LQLFHYHLVTSMVRQVEARYLGKLGFDLVARYGRLGDETVAAAPGIAWERLDRDGFKLRLIELERGAVNVVVQPGQWELPRVDHLGLALGDDDLGAALERAARREMRVQEYPGGRTFVALGVGYRLELHPPQEWSDALLGAAADFRLAELHLHADQPGSKAAALGAILDLPVEETDVQVGPTLVRFLSGGPQGRPELRAERFV